MNPINIVCMRCGFTGAVNKVTAGLRCTCGSDDLDLYTGSDEQRAHLARLHRTEASAPGAPTFAQFMLGSKTTAGPKNVEPNWDEYEGPMPGPNPMSNGVGVVPCPVCHGEGYDLQDGGPCRECGGDGDVHPTTANPEPPAVAKHNYPSTQTRVPFMGQRKKKAGRPSSDPYGSPEEHIRATTPGYTNQGMQGPDESKPFSWNDPSTHYPKMPNSSPAAKSWEPYDYTQTPDKPFDMHGSWCPECGQGPLNLQKDHQENAWAACPNCGPLVNVDKHPDVDPYNFPDPFTPNGRGYKAPTTARKLLAGKKTGRMLRMISTIVMANPGLSPREVVGIARTSLRKYPESK